MLEKLQVEFIDAGWGDEYFDLGGHWISWLKSRYERPNGGGSRAGSNGFEVRQTFRDKSKQPCPVIGPIAVGYGCHFG